MSNQTPRTKYHWRGAVQAGAIAALVLAVILPLCYYLSAAGSDSIGINQSIAWMLAFIGLLGATVIGCIVWLVGFGRSREKDD
jgi:hypothetical protein